VRSHIALYNPLSTLRFILYLISVLFWPLWIAVASIHERDLTTALFSLFFSSCTEVQLSALFWPPWSAVASIHERDLTTALFSRFFSSCSEAQLSGLKFATYLRKK
jgi:hypothetical protein